jgi:diguanylate cyclase (GGDEF)-like protein/PAS domain S-box-containing protein
LLVILGRIERIDFSQHPILLRLFLSIWKPRLASSLTRQDRTLFYGCALAALLCVLPLFSDLLTQRISLLAYIGNLALCGYCLLTAIFDDQGGNGEGLIVAWLPALVGVLAIIMGTGVIASTEFVLIMMLWCSLLLMAVAPFGLFAAASFSVALLLANLVVIIGSTMQSALLVIVVLVLYGGYWYRTYVLYGQSANKEMSSPVPPYAEEDRLKLEELQQLLAQRERDFERNISQQTKHLRDANTQLSQQIALRKTISDALVKSQTRLTQAIDASHLGLIDWDIAAGQFYQSAFHKHFGEKEQTSEQVIERLKEIIHPADYELVRDTLNACLRGDKDAYDLQYRVKDEHSWCWIEECGKVIDRGGDGRALRLLGTRRNIQSEVQRNEQVRLAKSVFDHTTEGVFVLDPNGVFLSANPAYAEMIGCDIESLIGQQITEISDTPSRKELYNSIFEQALREGSWQGELLEKRAEGGYYPQWTQVNAIVDELGQHKYFSGMVDDISDRKAADEKLDYLLNYDDLTKLANRVQFQDQLHRALLRYKDDHVPFVLVLLDIDRFKQFNDSFGHEATDGLLVEIANRLSDSVQQVDILARVGGNEFACIVECSSTFDVQKFSERLFHSVTTAQYEVAGHEVMLSCSIGVARVPEDTQDIETLMRYGALAVQKAKYHGGNHIQMFDESLKSFSRRRLEMEHELRKALTNNELEVYYQPKLDLKQNKITSYEALIRWAHPTLGMISPEEFVNIAEENGLITDLGEFVLRTACEQTQQWIDAGFGTLLVSVNLSARQLKEVGFQGVISATLERSQILPECLELELTESMIMEDAQSAISILAELRKTGVKVSIDDFGTGYSSLSYLRELPVDTLKIDKAFVDNMETSNEQLAIVKAIVVLGETLGLQIVAEGVENKDQLQLLRSLGCNLIQGYLVSKPLTATEMEALLSAQVA